MKDAISSIHIEAGKISVVKHNDRTFATVNSIFNDEVNECDFSGTHAIKRFHDLLKPRIEAYSKRTSQKLNKKTITHLSAIVNTKQTTTMSELYLLANHIERTLGTKVFQIAIHRDEGHIKDGKNIKNYHAHIEMLGLDSDGYSIRRKLARKVLSHLQDKTAEILKMQRGINYAKEKKKRPKRLGTYEYKEAKRREEKVVEAVKNKFTATLNDLTKNLETTKRSKLNIENVLKELIYQFKLNIKPGVAYTYSQIKSLLLEKSNALYIEIERLQKENKTFGANLKNTEKLYLDLKQNNTDLSVALQDSNKKLRYFLYEVHKLKKQIELFEAKTANNKNSNAHRDLQKEEDEDNDNVFGFNF